MPPNNQKDSQNDNIDYHPVPKWLNMEYIEDIFKIYKDDKTIKINSMQSYPATAKGENYASVMTRCKLYYISEVSSTEQETSIIVKTAFEGDDFATEKMKDYDVFNREMDIYDQIIPKLNSLLDEINDNDKLFADIIYVDKINTAMIFEDLSVKLYKTVDRFLGLDMNHTKLALRKLAKMHATSAVLNDRCPGIFQTYSCGFYNRHTNCYSSYFVNTLDACGQMVSKLDNGLYKIFGNKIKKLLPYVMEYGARVFDAKDDELNVLAHGDLWITNLMYNYNGKTTNNPNDVVLIDFQYSVWTSPATDLQYFFNTSLKHDMQLDMHCQDELIQFYYSILSDTLKSLKFKGKIPSLHEFWIQFQKKAFFGFLSTCINQAVALNEDSSNADFQALMGENERAWNFKHALFKNKRIQDNMRKFLPIFDRRGLLDVY